MMTGITLAYETQLFLWSIVLGAALSLLYDLLRVLRAQTKHRAAAISLEDTLYFLLFAAITFGFSLKINSGQLRGYILLGEGLGWGLWHLTIGRGVVQVLGWVAQLLRRILRGVLRILLFPFYCLLRPLVKLARLVSARMRNFLKKVLQTQKYNLKRKQLLLYNLNSRFQNKRQEGESADGSQKEKTQRK